MSYSSRFNILTFDFGFDPTLPPSYQLQVGTIAGGLLPNATVIISGQLIDVNNPGSNLTTTGITLVFPFASPSSVTVFPDANGIFVASFTMSPSLAPGLSDNVDILINSTSVGSIPITSWTAITGQQLTIAHSPSNSVASFDTNQRVNFYANSGDVVTLVSAEILDLSNTVIGTLLLHNQEYPLNFAGILANDLVYRVNINQYPTAQSVKFVASRVRNDGTAYLESNVTKVVTLTKWNLPPDVTQYWIRSEVVVDYGRFVGIPGATPNTRAFMVMQNSSSVTELEDWVVTDSDGFVSSAITDQLNVTAGTKTLQFFSTSGVLLGQTAFAVLPSLGTATTFSVSPTTGVFYTAQTVFGWNYTQRGEQPSRLLAFDGTSNTIIYDSGLIYGAPGTLLATTHIAKIPAGLRNSTSVEFMSIRYETYDETVPANQSARVARTVLDGLQINPLPAGTYYPGRVFTVTGKGQLGSITLVAPGGTQTLTTTASLNWSATITAPATVGSYAITASQSNGAAPVTVNFTVSTTPTLTLNPEPITNDPYVTGSSTNIAYSGSGFPGSTVTVTLSGFSSPVVVTTTVNPSGLWAALLAPPRQLGGTYNYTINQNTPGETLTSPVPRVHRRKLEVFLSSNPVARIDLVQGSGATSFVVSGDANAPVTAASAPTYLNCPASFTLDPNGEYSITIPATTATRQTTFDAVTSFNSAAQTRTLVSRIAPSIPITVNVNTFNGNNQGVAVKPANVVFVNETYTLSGNRPNNNATFSLTGNGGLASSALALPSSSTYTGTITTGVAPLGALTISGSSLYQESGSQQLVLSPVLYLENFNADTNSTIAGQPVVFGNYVAGTTCSIRVIGTPGQRVTLISQSASQGSKTTFFFMPASGFYDFLFYPATRDITAGWEFTLGNTYFSYPPITLLLTNSSKSVIPGFGARGASVRDLAYPSTYSTSAIITRTPPLSNAYTFMTPSSFAIGSTIDRFPTNEASTTYTQVTTLVNVSNISTSTIFYIYQDAAANNYFSVEVTTPTSYTVEWYLANVLQSSIVLPSLSVGDFDRALDCFAFQFVVLASSVAIRIYRRGQIQVEALLPVTIPSMIAWVQGLHMLEQAVIDALISPAKMSSLYNSVYRVWEGKAPMDLNYFWEVTGNTFEAERPGFTNGRRNYKSFAVESSTAIVLANQTAPTFFSRPPTTIASENTFKGAKAFATNRKTRYMPSLLFSDFFLVIADLTSSSNVCLFEGVRSTSGTHRQTFNREASLGLTLRDNSASGKNYPLNNPENPSSTVTSSFSMYNFWSNGTPINSNASCFYFNGVFYPSPGGFGTSGTGAATTFLGSNSASTQTHASLYYSAGGYQYSLGACLERGQGEAYANYVGYAYGHEYIEGNMKPWSPYQRISARVLANANVSLGLVYNFALTSDLVDSVSGSPAATVGTNTFTNDPSYGNHLVLTGSNGILQASPVFSTNAGGTLSFDLKLSAPAPGVMVRVIDIPLVTGKRLIVHFDNTATGPQGLHFTFLVNSTNIFGSCFIPKHMINYGQFHRYSFVCANIAANKGVCFIDGNYGVCSQLNYFPFSASTILAGSFRVGTGNTTFNGATTVNATGGIANFRWYNRHLNYVEIQRLANKPDPTLDSGGFKLLV